MQHGLFLHMIQTSVPSCRFKDDIYFLLLLLFIFIWKNLVQASLAFSQINLDACLLLDLSTAARPSTRSLRSLRRTDSPSESLLLSYAISKCIMTSLAMCSCSRTLLNRGLLHCRKATAVSFSFFLSTVRANPNCCLDQAS
jgi:hypothetical protein